MVKKKKNKIVVEYRCKKCGKLMLKIAKKSIDERKKSDIILIRCSRCCMDNEIDI